MFKTLRLKIKMGDLFVIVNTASTAHGDMLKLHRSRSIDKVTKLVTLDGSDCPTKLIHDILNVSK